MVINQLNSLPSYIDPFTQQLPATPVAPNLPPFYVDVNGDGFLTGADALAVINYLNLIAAEPQAGGGAAAASLRVSNSTVDASASSTAVAAAGEFVATKLSTSSAEARASASQLVGIALAAHDTTAYSPATLARSGAGSIADSATLSTPATSARIEARGMAGESLGSDDGSADGSADGDDFDGVSALGLAGVLKGRGRTRGDRAIADIFANHADGDDALALDDLALEEIVSWRASSRRQSSAGGNGVRRGRQG